MRGCTGIAVVKRMRFRLPVMAREITYIQQIVRRPSKVASGRSITLNSLGVCIPEGVFVMPGVRVSRPIRCSNLRFSGQIGADFSVGPFGALLGPGVRCLIRGVLVV